MTHAASLQAPPAPAAGAQYKTGHLDAGAWTQLVNQAGRQRMLSQRIILHALLAVQGDAAARAVAGDALASFRRSHEALSRGQAETPMPDDARLHDAFHGPQGADPAIRAFIRQAEATLQSAAGTAHGHALAARLAAEATPILLTLQKLTQLYELLAMDAAKAQKERTIALIERIHLVAREARIVSFNARISASRAGEAGREFAAVAEILARVTDEIEQLARQAAQIGR